MNIKEFEKINPMLAYAVEFPFDSVFKRLKSTVCAQLKSNGIRILIHKKGDHVKLYTRTGNEVTPKFREIQREFLQYPFDFVVDGELINLNKKGKHSFRDMINWFRNDIKEGFLQYHMFDVLKMEDYQVHNLTYKKRKNAMKEFIENTRIRFVENVVTKDHHHPLAGNKGLPDQQRLGDTFGFRLHRIGER